ncbi:hypothetical protein FB45DRAFT_843471 [Roridomyces roridus]|uniref:Monooxygenase n=1 Tax=Roridomyces roridus TaxID=1738132 RepID=A0AAD7FAF3_9AGAR|nr:hypothetical protein FB45DRAFT_843471 [Roridomyces roridus]
MHSHDIVIIGAGIGGVTLAVRLKRQLGREFVDFKIFEKTAGIGGTWRDNVYPGASSDTSIHFYSLFSDLSPDWPSTHGSQPDTLAYWEKLANKYNINRHIAFNTLVVSATWDAKESVWYVVTEDAKGNQSTTKAKIVISAIGFLEVPRVPNIPGLASFRGSLFHSARWDTELDLRNKRIAVVGNGASGTQFIPKITQDPSVNVTNFCRTPNWYLPNIRADYGPWKRWAFRNVPFAMRLTYIWQWCQAEMLYFTVFQHRFLASGFKKLAKGYISQTAPAEYVPHLIPNYTLGCKRLLFDNNYLAALHRPNLSLNWEGIQKVEEGGLVTRKGEKMPFDVMIFATGFVSDRFPLDIRGQGGKSIQQYYDTQGGPKGYLGTAIPGFPNLFMLAGPNTASGHISLVYTEALQIDYIMQFVKPLLTKAVTSFEVTHAATNKYDATIQRMLSRSVFVTCNSWYRVGGTGKNTSIFPGPGMLFWWWTRQARWSDYQITGRTGRWTRKVWGERAWWLVSRVGVLALLLRMGSPRHFDLVRSYGEILVRNLAEREGVKRVVEVVREMVVDVYGKIQSVARV